MADTGTTPPKHAGALARQALGRLRPLVHPASAPRGRREPFVNHRRAHNAARSTCSWATSTCTCRDTRSESRSPRCRSQCRLGLRRSAGSLVGTTAAGQGRRLLSGGCVRIAQGKPRLQRQAGIRSSFSHHSTLASAGLVLLSLKIAAAAASDFTACAPTSGSAVVAARAGVAVAGRRAAAPAEATGEGLSPTRPANSSEDSNSRAVRTAASSGTDMRLRVFSCAG